MREVWITEAGEPEVLKVIKAADPKPGKGELRIRVAFAGINFADIMARMGLYPDLPGIPIVVGYEVSGEIDAVGPGVDKSMIGKKVTALTKFGGYSDVVCVEENQARVLPEKMTLEEAAALPVNYLTTYVLVVVMGGLRAGDTMLIQSAGGGVGIAATQMAKDIGAKVIGTASAGKHEYIKSIGVDEAIDYRTEDFEKRVMEITEGRGVELALDAIGGKSFVKSYNSLSLTGRLGMFGASSGSTGKKKNLIDYLKMAASMPWLKFNPVRLMNDNRGVFGVNMGRIGDRPDKVSEWFDALIDMYERGVIKPKVDKTFSFEDAPLAHHYIQDRKNIGKVLLHP